MEYEKTSTYKKIKKAMLGDLRLRGLTSAVYTDKVQEYMDFWVQLQLLKEDVQTRGVTVETAQGKIGENKNVAMCVTVAKQMQSIVTFMGFKPDTMSAAKTQVAEDEL